VIHRDSYEIIKTSEKDIPKLANALAIAFNNDPCFLWMFREDSKRMEALTSFFSFILKNAYPYGEVFASKNYGACAIWYPPGKGFLDDSPETIKLLQPLMLEWATKEKIDRLFDAMKLLGQRPSEPHGYLSYIGVKPEFQGRGLGTRLIREKMKDFDSNAVPVYLENSNWRKRTSFIFHVART
jgi:ribosomal protein S18 acetylase RimI-like enzyme